MLKKLYKDLREGPAPLTRNYSSCTETKENFHPLILHDPPAADCRAPPGRGRHHFPQTGSKPFPPIVPIHLIRILPNRNRLPKRKKLPQQMLTMMMPLLLDAWHVLRLSSTESRSAPFSAVTQPLVLHDVHRSGGDIFGASDDIKDVSTEKWDVFLFCLTNYPEGNLMLTKVYRDLRTGPASYTENCHPHALILRDPLAADCLAPPYRGRVRHHGRMMTGRSPSS